jgi:hypothetical protein
LHADSSCPVNVVTVDLPLVPVTAAMGSPGGSA